MLVKLGQKIKTLEQLKTFIGKDVFFDHTASVLNSVGPNRWVFCSMDGYWLVNDAQMKKYIKTGVFEIKEVKFDEFC